jgi:hypothetical protein
MTLTGGGSGRLLGRGCNVQLIQVMDHSSANLGSTCDLGTLLKRSARTVTNSPKDLILVEQEPAAARGHKREKKYRGQMRPRQSNAADVHKLYCACLLLEQLPLLGTAGGPFQCWGRKV